MIILFEKSRLYKDIFFSYFGFSFPEVNNALDNERVSVTSRSSVAVVVLMTPV